MSRQLTLAGFILAGIRHKPGRNLALVFCFAFIAANIFAAQYLLAGAAGGIDTGASRMGADLLVIPAEYTTRIQGFQMGPLKAGTIIRVEPTSLRFNADVMDKIRKSPDVAGMSPQLFVVSLTDPALAPAPFDIYGIDPVTDFTVRPWLREPLKNPLGHGEIIAGNAIGADTGTMVTIAGTSYTVIGKLEPTRSPVDTTVFMTLEDAYALAAAPGIIPAGNPPVSPGTVNAVLIRLEPGSDLALAGARIQQPFSLGQVRVLEKHFALQPVSQAVEGLPGILTMITAVVILAAFPLVGLIAAMAAHERQREIGLLLSMGARKMQVFFLVMAEALLLSLAGGITGIIAVTGIVLYFTRGEFLTIPLLDGFRVSSAGETAMMGLIALAIVILIGSLSSLWPAWRSSRMNPYNAIRDES